MDDMQELLEDFLVESFELIEQIDHDLVELESNPDDLELLNRIFRVAHTVKGSSSFLNFDTLTKLTHHMEDVLNKARHGELKITADVMDVVLKSVDMMKGLLVSIRDNGNDSSSGIDISQICPQLTAISEGQSPTSATPAPEPAPATAPAAADIPPSAIPEDIDPNTLSEDQINAEIERLLKVRKAEDEARRAAKASGAAAAPAAPATAPAAAPDKSDATDKPAAAAKPAGDGANAPAKASANASDQTIRVEVGRLDYLMNLVGELVLSKNRLLTIYNDVEERYDGEQFLEELNQVVSSLSLVTTDVQLAVMKTRMQPVAKVFNKFPRVVRDIGRDLNKQIDLIISGEETELDKSIVEEIGDPLTHIIRNSCDHGIEDPATRKAAGKPEKGTIELKAYNEGNHIVIEIIDDGKGIDAEAIRIKAVERGLISENEADTMSNKEIYSIIFRPGFSMAAKVTNISGRGVGMDVVKTNVEKLHGVIDIDSEIGKGTTLKLKIPLTLAIIQSLLVGTQEEIYAIPLANVNETVRVSVDNIYTIEGKNVLRLRDEVLSLVRLSDLFGVKQVLESGDQTYVVVISVAETKLGIIVDNLIGQEEIVIKSLGSYLANIDGIAGGTIRGDGRVTLIVDVGVIMDMAKEVKVDIKSSMSAEATQKAKESPADYKVLVVDDSKMDRTIISKALAPTGITLIEATNGLEALNIIKSSEHAFDAVLIDIEMPKMDGYTLAGEIRKYSKYRNLPLIAVTSRTSKSDRLRGVEVGMTEYITKPYSAEYLENVVRKNIKLP
ncbi:chemotaxis protein CheW [Campylobacter sp.]|uniref:hybrid sensor histidine kinase/response regulator n=1 Tax=Campylobacter sp. TaxID=205 RepID=UPI002A4FFF17|nr:chemotaxis protein CheW [Campylobacter sp.]MDD7090715.1 response regulator [Campylobacteraceae bacterium]MDY5285844.1 response regulator [Campylobacter sp.]